MNYKIVIDAGHDTAQDGKQQQEESLINIEYAKELHRIICGEQYTDINLIPILTHTRDTNNSPTLKERADFINKTHADMLISLHCNWVDRPQPHGFNVFYRRDDSQSKRLAYLISARMQMSGCSHWGEPEQPADFYILRETLCPAILIEVGFMSNPDDLALIKDPIYINKVCINLERGIKTFYV